MEQFINYGLAGATLFILFFIVKYFVAAMTKKDDTLAQQFKAMTEMSEDFNKTISNHMAHEQKAFDELTKAIKQFFKKK